jgi:hypothetical protein
MYARAIDDAASRLRELRQEERGDLGLAAVAISMSLLATQLWPTLALPLFLGGAFVAARGARAAWRRAELVDGLAADRDAHAIEEVRRRALREADFERRCLYAAYVRAALERSPAGGLGVAAEELEELASELEDETLALDPASAVACARLASDPYGSPLLNAAHGPEELRSRVRQARAGFAPR